MLSKILAIGEEVGHQDRIRGIYVNNSETIAPAYVMVEDYKKVKSGELPKCRLVVGGNSSMSVHLSNILSDVVENLAESLDNKAEVKSRAHMLNKIDTYNAKVR